MEKKSELTFEDDGRGMVFTARGVVAGEHLVDRHREIYSPEVVQQLHYQIIDLRELERLDMTTEQMREIAIFDRKAAEQSTSERPMRVALVAAHDLTEALARIYCAYADSAHLEARVFADPETAREWASEG